ncbi:hypothetical protein PCE31107_02757 [Pandoraea cepalis]|uniref:Uncharacterized protein n=1 Tax=Pandoraea cepalis TaxID=2508294 RepID=A0A5E4VQG7_9BURK|nr:hypothetical protein PCE31107_02757 [Pandoraea cepalis]
MLSLSVWDRFGLAIPRLENANRDVSSSLNMRAACRRRRHWIAPVDGIHNLG